MRKISTIAILLIAILLLSPFRSKAQNSVYPWAIGVNWQWQDYNVVHQPIKDVFTQAHWQGYMFPSHLSIKRYLNPSFNLFLQFGISALELDRMKDYNAVKDTAFWTADINLAYKFANGYILKETSWFDPYIFIGGGATGVKFEKPAKATDDPKEYYFKASPGIGFNFWLTKKLALNFQAAYDYMITPDLGGEFRNDYLHTTAGINFRFGAKDKDGDGVVDKYDLCPDQAGPKELSGCPDSDGDGIADKDDECPKVAGKIEFKGCPDTDGDGIPDLKDDCPNVAGTKDLKGCPDKDGDGIADHLDKCPDVFGKAEFDGCPDTDGDGIADYLDECPDVKGLAKFNGCPDTDGDGIPDHLDKCPTVAGVKENNGCPAVEVEKPTVEIYKVVYFSTAQSSVITKYIKDLDEVAKIMKENADVKVSVAGHADQRGADDLNMRLSEKRADYVINYLVKKGIKKERLIKSFFGETQPASTLDNAEGWDKNRRVEIKSTL